MKNRKTFRLFISSTFNDFREERKVLQTKVFPEIKRYCLEKGYRFQPIDLRWGINEEAQLDQKTLGLCLEEVRTCKSYPHPNFLVMLGDRYGWIPLPYAIEQNEFEEILEFSDDNEKSLLKEWYQLDKNQLPASYILKQREGKYERIENWNIVENTLLSTLQKSVKKISLSDEQKRKYFVSATEAEIEEGIIPYIKPTAYQKKILLDNPSLITEDVEYIFGFIRNIEKNSIYSNKFIANDYKEAQKLKRKVKAVLLNKNIFEYNTIQINENDLKRSYLQTFETKIIKFLKEKLDLQIAKETKYTELELEKQEQKYFAAQKRENFIGQEKILKKIDNYIKNDNQQAFVLYGKSGSGKSSIIAKAIEIAEKDSKVIYRFVGATSNSSSSISLLTSIFNELGVTIIKTSQNKDKETFKEFSSRINDAFLEIKENVVIFIDAVDQLTNNDQFLWLPDVLPKNVKIIISALNDINYQTDSTYFKNLKNITANFHLVKPFNKPNELLIDLLKKENRTIQKHQLNYFLNQYSNTKTPLYVYVASQEIKHWKSDDLTEVQTPTAHQKTQTLANSQKGIIREFIKNLSTFFHHDKYFVQKVLAYIYVSKEGLSENELLELLNTDKKFINQIAPNTWHQNTNKKLPLVIWTRLYTQLKSFLSKKSQDNEELLFFFHREFVNVITNYSIVQFQNKKIIEVVLLKIKKHQFEDFYHNRWGRLFSLIIYNYSDNYSIRKNSKWYSEFLKIDDEYTEIFLQWILNQWDLYTNANSEYLKIAYAISELLYKNNPERWGESYTFSINDLAFSYSQINKLKLTLKLEKKALEIREKKYLNHNEWEDEYTTSLLNISNTYSSLNDIDLAIYYSEKALVITKSNFNKESNSWLENYVINLNHLASYYKIKNSLSKALSYSKKAYTIISKYYKKQPDVWFEQYFTTIRDLADLFFMNNQLDKAEKLNLENLKIIEELYKKNNEKWAHHFVTSLNQIAVTYHELNSISKSIEYETKVFNLVSNHFKKEQDYWMVSYLQVVNNLNYNNPNIDVLTIFKETKELCKTLYKKLPERWAQYYFSILNNIAYYYLDNFIKLKEASKLFKEALVVIEPLFNKNPNNWIEQYLSALNNIAAYNLEISEPKKAIEILQKAFQLISKYHKEEPNRWKKDYVLYLSNISYAYALNGQNKKAIELEKKNFKILKQLYFSDKKLWSVDFTKSLNNLAFLLKENNKVQQAIKLEKEALRIIRNLYKNDKTAWAKELVNVINNIAYSYMLRKDIIKAKYYYKQEFLLLENLYKENNNIWAKEYATLLNDYAYLIQNPKTKLAYYKKAHELIEIQYRNQAINWKEEYTSSLRNLAYAYKRVRKIDRAILLEEKSLKIVEKLYKTNNGQWADNYILCLINLGDTYHFTNEYKIAIKYEKKAVKILRPLFVENPNLWIDDFVTVINNLGVSYRELKQYKIAKVKLLEALDIIENVFEENSNIYRENYQLVLDNLLTLYKNMGSNIETEKIANKLLKIKNK